MGFNSKILLAVSLFSSKILTTPQYTNHNLEDGSKVCPLSGQQGDLNLGKDNRSAIIVQDQYYFDDWSGEREFDCRFTVKAHFHMGVFAVIQKMALRKDPDTGACIDFIQFRPPLPFRQKMLLKAKSLLKKGSDPWDKTYCGKVDPSERRPPDLEDPGLALYGYALREGEMEVRVHVADRRLEPGERIGLKIAFTAFMDCKAGPLGAYKSCGEDTCIYKEYFSDEVLNCPYVTCKDEPECAAFVMETELLEKGINTKVYITAVSSIFLSFFLFLGCIMLCRYFDLLCWSEPPELGGVGGGLERRGSASGAELEQVSPSAPPDSPDKDLPPAYETLFPSSDLRRSPEHT